MKIGAIVSLSIAAIVFAAPSQNFADVPANAAGLSKAIFAEIDALARQTRTSGTLPRWSDDAQRAVLARFWDEDALLGQPPHTSAEVPLLLDIGDSHTALLKTYMVFTRKPGDLPDMAANSFEFQSELARAFAFEIAQMSATAQALEDFLSGLAKENLTEIRREGLRQMRLGYVESIAGFALFIRSPRLSDANREIVAKALARHAATLARSMQPADRLANAANARASLPALNAAARTNVETFIAAMSDPGCDGLCAIP